MPHVSPNPHRARKLVRHPSILTGVICLVAVALYWPGLSGDFLFDDWVNLPALGRYGPVRDWDGLLRYLTSGIADPTGRPVSMLSFLIDARDWPAEPWPFKRTNLILHACNGMALYGLLIALGRHLPIQAAAAQRAAFVASAAWLLHPLWVSTVLYVVQRHAMLATLFVLLGLHAWVLSREAFARGAIGRGWSFAMLSVPICGLLAGLSKANGFLLPLLLLTLELTVLRPKDGRESNRHQRYASVLLLWLPSVAVMTVLALQAGDADVLHRPWTTSERLMTQPRALFDYIRHLLIPGVDAMGIFADGFSVSHGWWSPVTTLPAALLLVALLGAAWTLRFRAPAFSAAVLFYFAGHVMESSFLPLELYFEHRNYLPALLFFWPVALWITQPGPHLRLRLLGPLGFLLVCAFATHAQAKLWGDPRALAQSWALQQTGSARAQVHAASFDMARGDYDQVISVLGPLLAADPEEIQYALTLLEARCGSGTVTPSSLHITLRAMEARGLRTDVVSQWLARTLHPDRRGICSGLPDATLAAFLRAVAVHGPAPVEDLAREKRLQGLFSLRSEDCPGALSAFDSRIDFLRRPEFAQEQVALLATYCGPDTALAHLDHYLSRRELGDHPAASPMLRLRDRIIARQGMWKKEWDRLHALLERERQAMPADSP